MRFEITEQWGDGNKYDGVLYCAQRIEEMLMVYTSHLYKVPVYNTLLLAYEFMQVYSTIAEKSIDQAHLRNITEEFVNEFSSDIVIKDHFSSSQIEYFVGKLTGSSIAEQQKLMNYLIHLMSDYPQWSKDILKKVVQNPKEKKNIDKALRSYIPTIMCMDYHPQAIYKVCKKVFKKKCSDGFRALDIFLDRFNGIEKEYNVYFVVDKKVEGFKNILETRLDASFEQYKNSTKLKYSIDKQICICMTKSALDVNGAAVERTMHLIFL